VNKHLQSHISFIARFVKIFSMDYRDFGDVMKFINKAFACEKFG
jgi:hypothetical protein